jgi:hypothetical protein
MGWLTFSASAERSGPTVRITSVALFVLSRASSSAKPRASSLCIPVVEVLICTTCPRLEVRCRSCQSTATGGREAPKWPRPMRRRREPRPTSTAAISTSSSGSRASPLGTLEEHLRLGAGFAAADRPHILEAQRRRLRLVIVSYERNIARAMSALAPHLSGWEHDQVDLEVSLKDTEGPDQKVTLQAWSAERAHLVATSHERDLDHALAEVRRDLIRQIEDERSRREPRKRRKTRYRTT